MEKRYIIGLDEGTTSARAVLFDLKLNKIISSYKEVINQYYPNPGWVEQNPEEIWKAQKKVLDTLLIDINPNQVIGIGITNQRETIIAWNKKTGKPIYNAIVWQCRRTSKMIERLPSDIKRKIKTKTGLIPNAYFSASKIKWIIDNVKEAKDLAKNGQLCIGTIDSFLAYKLTGKHITDTTNASRTMLFNIRTMSWDEDLLNYFKIPESCLPKIVDSNTEVGICKEYGFPLCGIIGDQQSSLLGQACIKKGTAKATYGTGAFILLNTGNKIVKTPKMICTVGYTINGKTTYALEGSVYSACQSVDWLKNNLGLYEDVKDTAKMCESVESTGGVYFVPAFTGLGAPYWNDNTKGMIVGMNLSTNKNHLVRACIESIAYNTFAVIKEMASKNIPIKELHVDGGGSKNSFLLQFQADMLQRNVLKSKETESTALGAIYLVGLCKKIFNMQYIEENYQIDHTHTPMKTLSERNNLYKQWDNAIYTTSYYGKIIK